MRLASFFKDTRFVGFVAAFNLLDAVVLLAMCGLFVMYLRMGVELPRPRTGEVVSDTAAGALLPFVWLNEFVGTTVVFAAAALLAAILVMSTIGLVRRRNWARLLTIATIPLRPVLVFSVSVALSRTSTDMVDRFGPSFAFLVVYACIVWYLFQPEVKRAFRAA